MTIWNGISLDHWAQTQTLHPSRRSGVVAYAGFVTYASSDWSDYIPQIPLALRFANFAERLNRALAK